jgi:hypothetical protein
MTSVLTALLTAILVAPAPAPCEGPHREFDFWLGEWEVRQNTPEGALAGHNRIERVAGGCGLVESWTGAKGTIGTSLNLYDAGAKRWQQTWVDSSGTLLRLEGGREGDAMVMTGELPGPDGKPLRQRISWQALEDGSVRQHWQASPDGKQWTTAFDGIYRREGASE